MSQFTPFVPWNRLRSVLFRSLRCRLRTGDGQTWQWRQCALWWSCSITPNRHRICLQIVDMQPISTDACLIDARLVVALPRQCSEGRKQGWSQTAIRMYTAQRDYKGYLIIVTVSVESIVSFRRLYGFYFHQRGPPKEFFHTRTFDDT